MEFTLKPIYDKWFNFLKASNLSLQQSEALAKYASRLENSNFPVIFEQKHFSKLLGLELNLLSRMTGASSNFYRSFEFKKKKGGIRAIRSPYPKLAYVQKWIKKEILEEIPISKSAFAYVKGRSHIDNAKKHIGSKDLFKIDIIDFFDQIKFEKIYNAFIACGYSHKVSFDLTQLCTFWGKLPQGAPTSPSLSNIVLKKLDDELFNVCKASSLTYTRYADDISVSGIEISPKIRNEIIEVVENNGYPVNHKKTYFAQGKAKKVVTGLIVTDSEVRVSKSMRRDFRKKSFFLLKNGVNELNGKNKPINPLYIDEIIGLASYILKVEPNNKYVATELKNLKKLKQDLFLN